MPLLAQGLSSFGVAAFSITPYVNCVYMCGYCYIRDIFNSNFGRESTPNLKAVEEVKANRFSLEGESWILSAHTDPYPKVERRHRITRSCLEALTGIAFRKGIVVTKSDVILDDLGLLQCFGTRVTVGVSITTDLPEVSGRVEPRCICPERRLELASALRAAGVPVRILVAPALRHSDQFAQRIAAVADSVFVETAPYRIDHLLPFMSEPQATDRLAEELCRYMPSSAVFKGRHLLLRDSKS